MLWITPEVLASSKLYSSGLGWVRAKTVRPRFKSPLTLDTTTERPWSLQLLHFSLTYLTRLWWGQSRRKGTLRLGGKWNKKVIYMLMAPKGPPRGEGDLPGVGKHLITVLDFTRPARAQFCFQGAVIILVKLCFQIKYISHFSVYSKYSKVAHGI